MFSLAGNEYRVMCSVQGGVFLPLALPAGSIPTYKPAERPNKTSPLFPLCIRSARRVPTNDGRPAAEGRRIYMAYAQFFFFFSATRRLLHRSRPRRNAEPLSRRENCCIEFVLNEAGVHGHVSVHVAGCWKESRGMVTVA